MKRRATAADEQDWIDARLLIWATELPELDLATEGIVERIQKLAARFNHEMDLTLREFELKRGEWHLLAALRKSGPPYRRSPGQLSEDLGLSSGAMTHRLDRMESAGLIRRLPDPEDRRSLQIELTDAGWQLWQDSTGTQARKEALIAEALTDEEKEQLNVLLRRLMLAFERDAPVRD